MKKLLIVFAILCLAAPAMAADWNFYGSARFSTFYTDKDLDISGVDNQKETIWAQQGNSRIGATVKFNDQIGGRFEMSDSFGKRMLYGTYAFGNGSELLIGQTYTPSSSYFYSNSVFDGDGDLLGVGQFYTGRIPMIQWSMAGFKVALITPAVETYNESDATNANFIDDTGASYTLEVEPASEYDTESVVPKIEASYRFKGDMFFADVFGGYQTYKLDGATTDYDIDSYVVGVGGGMNFGALYFNAGLHWGQNVGNYGAYNPLGVTDSAVLDANGTLQDAESFGWLGVIGFNASEMFSIEAGYGWESAEVDNSNNTTVAQQMYLNSTINIAPGFFIFPEVGLLSQQNDLNAPEPETFYVGAKWQINF
jgi:hypothetical protein